MSLMLVIGSDYHGDITKKQSIYYLKNSRILGKKRSNVINLNFIGDESMSNLFQSYLIMD